MSFIILSYFTKRNLFLFSSISTGSEYRLWVPTLSYLLNAILSPSRSLQLVSVVYVSKHHHILPNVIRPSSRSLQGVGVVYESRHFRILLNIICSFSRRQGVNVIYESQHCHTLLNVICTPSWSPQLVNVVCRSQYCHISNVRADYVQ